MESWTPVVPWPFTFPHLPPTFPANSAMVGNDGLWSWILVSGPSSMSVAWDALHHTYKCTITGGFFTAPSGSSGLSGDGAFTFDMYGTDPTHPTPTFLGTARVYMDMPHACGSLRSPVIDKGLPVGSAPLGWLQLQSIPPQVSAMETTETPSGWLPDRPVDPYWAPRPLVHGFIGTTGITRYMGIGPTPGGASAIQFPGQLP